MDDKTRTDNDYSKEAAAAAVPAMCSSCDGNCLDDVEFLMGLNPQDRLRIMQGAVRRTYEKDRIIFHGCKSRLDCRIHGLSPLGTFCSLFFCLGFFPSNTL